MKTPLIHRRRSTEWWRTCEKGGRERSLSCLFIRLMDRIKHAVTRGRSLLSRYRFYCDRLSFAEVRGGCRVAAWNEPKIRTTELESSQMPVTWKKNSSPSQCSIMIMSYQYDACCKQHWMIHKKLMLLIKIMYIINLN